MSTLLAAIIIGLLIVNLVGLVLVGVRVGAQANQQRDLEARLSTQQRDLETRLIKLEVRVDNLPTHGDLLKLRTGISEVVENMATIAGQVQAQTQMLQTIQKHLLENE